MYDGIQASYLYDCGHNSLFTNHTEKKFFSRTSPFGYCARQFLCDLVADLFDHFVTESSISAKVAFIFPLQLTFLPFWSYCFRSLDFGLIILAVLSSVEVQTPCLPAIAVAFAI